MSRDMGPMVAERRDEGYDTEITLGTGKMLALFFGLVILCAVFFGMGFSMGRNSAKATPELLPSPSEGSRPTAKNETPAVSTPAAQTTSAPAVQTTADNTAPASAAQPATTPADQSQNAAAAQGTASQPNAGFYVQVAAVSKQEDAEALVDSLKGHQYQAFIANQPSDKLFHVQVGPFTDVKDAEAMRTKLVNDGYNPILKK